MKNLCFLSYISGHVWFSNLEKENETGLYSLQALSWLVPVYLYKVIPLLTHYIPAILNVSVSQTHHLINSCWKTLPPSHFAWFSPNPLSCICSDTAAFQKLVQTVWVPSSLFPQVLTFPCCWLPALSLWVVPGCELLEGEGSVPITVDSLQVCDQFCPFQVVELAKLLIALPLCLRSLFVEWV